MSSSLPDDIVLNMLARISKSQYHSVSLVSKSFYSLLSSPEIYKARSHIGNTEPRLYVSLYLPQIGASHHRWFTLTNPDQTLVSEVKVKGRLGLKPVKLSPPYEPPRINSTYVAVCSEIYQIGGAFNEKPSNAVRVLDCWTHKWHSAPNMLVARERANSCFLDGKIYVIGGHHDEESMNWGEVFDLKTQTWNTLPSPSYDSCLISKYKVEVFGARLYVITKNINYVYIPKEGRWLSEVGFVSIAPPLIRNGPYCVIKNVVFADYRGCCRWYNARSGKWLSVHGLGNLYTKCGYINQTLHLDSYGEKLVVIWHECKWEDEILYGSEHLDCDQDTTIWCAVIRLSFSGTEIYGEVEWRNVVLKVPESYMFLTSLLVSV